MEESLKVRAEEGVAILRDYKNDISNALKNLLASIEGFRRDVELAAKSDSPVSIGIYTKRIFLPPGKKDQDFFSSLAEMLDRITKAFEGKIELDKKYKKIQDALYKSESELFVIHQNLVFVGDSSKILYDTLCEASKSFYKFNGDNDDVHRKSDIIFDEESLSVCIIKARAIIEHSVRLDIDVMNDLEKIHTNDKDAFV